MIMSWIYSKKKIKKIYFCALVVSLSSIFSCYFSPDSLAYQSLFLRFSSTPFSNIYSEIGSAELFFVLSSKIFSFLPVFLYLFFYAFLSFFYKITLFEKASRTPTLSLMFYFAFFFLYFDGTVVRVSLGIAISYWGVYFLSKKRNLFFYVIVIFSGFFLHYSLFVLLIVPLFKSHSSIRFIWLLMFLFFILYFFDVGVLYFLPWFIHHVDVNAIGISKLVSALESSKSSYPYSFFYIVLFFMVFSAYSLFKDELNEFELISFNMLFLSFLILIVFYQSQEVQNRVSEIFRYSIVFLAPFFYKLFSCFFENQSKVRGMIVYCLFLISYFFYYFYFKGIIADKNLFLLYSLFSV